MIGSGRADGDFLARERQFVIGRNRGSNEIELRGRESRADCYAPAFNTPRRPRKVCVKLTTLRLPPSSSGIV
jgi:hypothetical protein